VDFDCSALKVGVFIGTTNSVPLENIVRLAENWASIERKNADGSVTLGNQKQPGRHLTGLLCFVNQ
jgi:hypothetical protein